MAQLQQLNEQRRKAMLADRLVTQVLSAMTASTVSFGTGLIMLLAASSLRNGSLTVGNFVLFVSYLTFIADFTTELGRFLAHYQQTGIAFARLNTLTGDAAPATLVAHTLLHLHGPSPTISPPVRQESDRLLTLEVRGLTYHYPQTMQGIDEIDLRLARGTLTIVTRPCWRRQNYASANPVRSAPPGCRRNTPEWSAHRRWGFLLCPAACRIHGTGTTPVQRNA